jgi:hypothetical protein
MHKKIFSFGINEALPKNALHYKPSWEVFFEIAGQDRNSFLSVALMAGICRFEFKALQKKRINL